MTQPRTITVAWLREQDACAGQVATVSKEWGETIPLTRENLRRAAALQLDLRWLAGHLNLGAEPWRIYAEATAEVLRIGNEAPAEPGRTRGPARPEAITTAVSEVDSSESIVTALKLAATAGRNAR